MNKVILYAMFALVLGLLLVLTPNIIFGEIKAQIGTGGSYEPPRESLLDKIQEFRSEYSIFESENSLTDLKILAISFVAAIIVYLLAKRKTPAQSHEYYRWTHPY